MPDLEALTPEQINLLRGLPGQLSELKKSPDAERLYLAGLLTRIGSPEYSTVVRTPAADLLLATIDSAVAAERERVQPCADELIAASLQLKQRTRFSQWGHTNGADAPVAAEAAALRVTEAAHALQCAIHPANPQGETDRTEGEKP